MNAIPILVLDDDAEFLEAVATELGHAGFAPVLAATVAAAEDLVQRGTIEFGALLLDVNLPDGDGRNLCARLRSAGVTAPVLMLSGVDAEHDVVQGLDAGANDYLAKPLRPAVLLARLRAQLRQHENSLDRVSTLGHWQFHPSRKLLRDAKGVRVWLTEKEVKILRYLQRSGSQVSKQMLLTHVWGYSPSTSTHTLETHIYRLRQKIEANPSEARIVLTAAGGGYQLGPDASGSWATAAA